jgi:probable HAF family extracellular repeat protein
MTSTNTRTNMVAPRMLLLLAGALSGSLAHAQTPTFTPLDFPENGYFTPAGVSADGTSVAGGSYLVSSGNRARRWRAGIGFDNPAPTSGNVASWASGISANGSTIPGGTGHAQFGDLEGWVRYGTSTGHVGSSAGHDTSNCLGVSHDGAVIVGSNGFQSNPNLYEAGSYTEQNGWVNLGFLPGGGNSTATAANSNGSVIVGWSTTDVPTSSTQAFRWTQSGGMVSIGNVPGGHTTYAIGVSADGNTIVGYDETGYPVPFRWTPASGIQVLPNLAGGSSTYVSAVSYDGAIVVGSGDEGGSNRAYIWDAAHGARKLQDVLVAQGLGAQLAGWDIDSADCIAGSGPYYIAGNSSGPDGYYHGYVVRLDSLDAPCLAPTITYQPSGWNLPAGGPAWFYADATGTGLLSYQWRLNGTDLSDGGAYSGAQTQTLSLYPISHATEGTFDCVVSNACGSIATIGAELRITTGAEYCFGDGTGTACPCNNDSPIGDQSGCSNSLGFGGRVAATGIESLSADTLVLRGSAMPNSSALYFQGTQQNNSGFGTVFGDGLRCVGGSVVRLGTKLNVAGESMYPESGDASISVRGGVTSAGHRTYQVWYRNAAAFCTSSTFNLTNGVDITWAS